MGETLKKDEGGQGASSGIKQHQFVLGNSQIDVYLKTIKAIVDYIGRNFSPSMVTLVQDREETIFNEPDEPGDDATIAAMKRYEMLLRDSIDRTRKYQEEKSKVFYFLLG